MYPLAKVETQDNKKRKHILGFDPENVKLKEHYLLANKDVYVGFSVSAIQAMRAYLAITSYRQTLLGGVDENVSKDEEVFSKIEEAHFPGKGQAMLLAITPMGPVIATPLAGILAQSELASFDRF